MKVREAIRVRNDVVKKIREELELAQAWARDPRVIADRAAQAMWHARARFWEAALAGVFSVELPR